MDANSRQLVLCGVPVFFNLPGSKSADLGGRTEGEQQYCNFHQIYALISP